MESIAAFIDAHVDEVLSLARLAKEAGMSPFHFQRRFKDVTSGGGRTPTRPVIADPKKPV